VITASEGSLVKGRRLQAIQKNGFLGSDFLPDQFLNDPQQRDAFRTGRQVRLNAGRRTWIRTEAAEQVSVA